MELHLESHLFVAFRSSLLPCPHLPPSRSSRCTTSHSAFQNAARDKEMVMASVPADRSWTGHTHRAERVGR